MYLSLSVYIYSLSLYIYIYITCLYHVCVLLSDIRASAGHFVMTMTMLIISAIIIIIVVMLLLLLCYYCYYYTFRTIIVALQNRSSGKHAYSIATNQKQLIGQWAVSFQRRNVHTRRHRSASYI